eukprot:13934084-Alexandrium_andersonii.AAC.1
MQHRAFPELPENALCALGHLRALSGIIGHFRALLGCARKCPKVPDNARTCHESARKRTECFRAVPSALRA